MSFPVDLPTGLVNVLGLIPHAGVRRISSKDADKIRAWNDGYSFMMQYIAWVMFEPDILVSRGVLDQIKRYMENDTKALNFWNADKGKTKGKYFFNAHTAVQWSWAWVKSGASPYIWKPLKGLYFKDDEDRPAHFWMYPEPIRLRNHGVYSVVVDNSDGKYIVNDTTNGDGETGGEYRFHIDDFEEYKKDEDKPGEPGKDDDPVDRGDWFGAPDFATWLRESWFRLVNFLFK